MYEKVEHNPSNLHLGANEISRIVDQTRGGLSSQDWSGEEFGTTSVGIALKAFHTKILESIFNGVPLESLSDHANGLRAMADNNVATEQDVTRKIQGIADRMTS